MKTLESLEYGDSGFNEVATIECTDQSYSFDIFGVIKGPDGRLWYGNTTGCSCPGQWHEYNYDPETLSTDLSPLNAHTVDQFEREASEWTGKVDPEARRDFIQRMRALVAVESAPRTE